MKKITLSDLTDRIENEKSKVERKILRNKPSQRQFRTRPRDADEIKILDRLCIERWKQAEEQGKIKYLSDRVWYYEFD